MKPDMYICEPEMDTFRVRLVKITVEFVMYPIHPEKVEFRKYTVPFTVWFCMVTLVLEQYPISAPACVKLFYRKLN